MKRIIWTIVALVALGAAVFLSIFPLAEIYTEVVILRTWDAEGEPHETRVTIIDIDGAAWVRGRPYRGWFRRIEANPAAELYRAGTWRPVEGAVSRDASDAAAFQQTMLDTYGLLYRYLDFIAQMSAHELPVRLDPRDAKQALLRGDIPGAAIHRLTEETFNVKHYCNPMSRAITTIWMFEELDVPHETVIVDFAAGEPKTPEYRAINPMGKVPTLVDGDVVVTEAAAICAYLADKFPEKGLAPPLDSPDRGRYYRYLFVPGTTIEPLFSLTTLGITHPNPGSAGWGDLERVMATVESMTPERDWALGQRFTAADLVFGGTLDFSIRFEWVEPSPKVEAYVDRLRSRPAYRRAHAAWEA